MLRPECNAQSDYADFPSLCAASRAIAAGQLSCVELAQDCLAKAEASEPALRAYAVLAPDSVLEQARARDLELSRGASRGALHGIPLAVKDVIDVQGLPTRAASRVLPNTPANVDAEIVATLRRLGAVVAGKANTHEFAFGATTPPTRNPVHVRAIAGGSSGGSAAAVAAGSAVFALGTDTGGSVRLPAALCGVVGLRPRPQAFAGMDGIVPLAPEFDQWGLIAKNSEDMELLWRSMTTPFGTADKAEAVELVAPDDMLLTMPDLDPEVERVVAAALDCAANSGFDVRKVPVPDLREVQASRITLQLRQVLRVHTEEGWWPAGRDLYGEEVRHNLDIAEEQAELSLEDARACVTEFDRAIDGLLAGSRVLALPTTPIVAPQFDDIERLPLRAGERHPLVKLLAQGTLPFSRPALATMTLPCGANSKGLPVGLQIVGRSEIQLLNAAVRIERMLR